MEIETTQHPVSETDPTPHDELSRDADTQRQRKARPTFGTIARSTLITTAAVVGAITIVIVAICLITGVRPAIVVSGSMSPTIPTGSMTFAREIPVSEVQVGDIVTVDRVIGSGLVTHRVIDITEADGATELLLQGDANDAPDPAPYPVRTVGEVVFHVPWLGTAAAVIRTPLGLTSVALLVIVFMILGFVSPRERTQDARQHRSQPRRQ